MAFDKFLYLYFQNKLAIWQHHTVRRLNYGVFISKLQRPIDADISTQFSDWSLFNCRILYLFTDTSSSVISKLSYNRSNAISFIDFT